MGNPTMTLIASNTVGSGGVSSVTFSSIPQTGYTDLKLVTSARSIASVLNADVLCYFNGNSTSFSWRIIQGNGSGASSANATGAGRLGIMPAGTATANTFSNIETDIPNYTGGNNKSFSTDSAMENNATLSYVEFGANLWSNTSAITTIQVVSGNGSFAQYSTFYLYGINNS